MIQEAFFKVCDEAKVAEQFYVSLYHIESYYGGPEEGGWWGENQRLVAYQVCETEERAETVYKAVKELAEGLTRGAKIEYSLKCRQETEWLEARGLDDSFLPEVDGSDSYCVMIEKRPGENILYGPTHYE